MKLLIGLGLVIGIIICTWRYLSIDLNEERPVSVVKQVQDIDPKISQPDKFFEKLVKEKEVESTEDVVNEIPITQENSNDSPFYKLAAYHERKLKQGVNEAACLRQFEAIELEYDAQWDSAGAQYFGDDSKLLREWEDIDRRHLERLEWLFKTFTECNHDNREVPNLSVDKFRYCDCESQRRSG